jgi:hypothetical protein
MRGSCITWQVPRYVLEYVEAHDPSKAADLKLKSVTSSK